MLNENEADCLMIAGMGGVLMHQILSENMKITLSCRELVLQPQSNLDIVRKFLRENNFIIDKEDMVKEDDKYYTVIHAVNTKKSDLMQNEESKDKANELEIFDLYGKYLLLNQHPVLKDMLEKLYEKYNTSLKAASMEGKDMLIKKIHKIQEGLKYYGM